MRNRAPALFLRLKVYFLASVWLSVAFLYFLWQLPLFLAFDPGRRRAV